MWDKPALLNWIANLLYALSMVAVLYAVVYVVVHLPIFPLREVKVDGELHHVSREQVKLIVAKHLKGNFFTLDLINARNAFEKLPWARNVSVRRRWPDKLEVVIEEHEALARWGSTALVNKQGELFHAASGSDLPVFYGPDNGVIEVASQYDSLNKVLQSAKLQAATLALTPRRAWQITTTNGMVLELGRVEMQPRLEKFANIYSSILVRLNKKITYVDLRYPSGFAVRKPTEALNTEKENVTSVEGNQQAAGVANTKQRDLNVTKNSATQNNATQKRKGTVT
ncbi:MAG: cell division protein FtsQ [Methylotenera sp.]|uniref:cell division protein FtsQ/DivIB n=1 Tax=Methylotenera sp. TaxID=2051956 RepID=UPI000D4E8001|nr:cell division protein FtsQ/DivIB [Methylotenera sp.]PPC83727.1 MAG: cell division protein FtsQ [Methylotenera sp.]